MKNWRNVEIDKIKKIERLVEEFVIDDLSGKIPVGHFKLKIYESQDRKFKCVPNLKIIDEPFNLEKYYNMEEAIKKTIEKITKVIRKSEKDKIIYLDRY